jgi:hypothetical protein
MMANVSTHKMTKLNRLRVLASDWSAQQRHDTNAVSSKKRTAFGMFMARRCRAVVDKAFCRSLLREFVADEGVFRHFGAVECRNLKDFWCCSLRSSHFYWRHTSKAAENGAVLTVYANRFTRKGARSVCRILTRQARSRMRIAGQPGLQKPPSPGLTGGLPRVVAREPFPDLLPATSGRIDDGNAKCCTAVIALHFFRSLR